MVETITVIHKKVGERPHVVEVQNDFRAMQQLVGGLIECLNLPNGMILVFDEEGLLKEYKPNLQFDANRTVLMQNNQIRGDVFVTIAQGPDFRSLTKKEQQTALAFLEEFAVLHRQA